MIWDSARFIQTIRLTLFPSVVLLNLWIPGGQAAKKPPAEDPNLYYAEGVQANDRGDYAKAVERLEKVYALEPTEGTIRSNLYRALQNYSIDLAQRGDAAAAIEACSKAITLFPNDVTTASNLAIFFNNRAVELLNELRMNDSMEALRNADANERALEGALEAIETAGKVVTGFRFPQLRGYVDPTHAAIYLLKGRHEYLRGNTAEALNYYDKSISLNPNETGAYIDRSRIYAQQRRYDDAISDLNEVQALSHSENPKVAMLIDRLTREAEALGIPLSGPSDFFEVEMIGGNLDQERTVRKLLKEIRREVAGSLQAISQNPLVAIVDWTLPLLRVPDLLGTQPPPVTSEGFRIGAEGASLSSPDFKEALKFHYILALLRNLSDDTIPYWFASGIAQILVGGDSRLSPEERAKLIAADENSQLLGTRRLTWSNLAGLEDSQTLRLANLEAKTLVAHMADVMGINGVGQILAEMKAGLGFEQALREVSRMAPNDLDDGWRKDLGIHAN